MIPYHGVPLTPEAAAAVVYASRHVMVSFAHPDQLAFLADIVQSFSLDNGAFSAWRSGNAITDWEPFYEWVEKWLMHPGCDFFLIPDVIDGTENDNDLLIEDCPYDAAFAVPIWHLHESLERLDRLTVCHLRIAFGSSGDYAEIGTDRWWHRMAEAMNVVCVDGRPRVKLHGLRMLNTGVFTQFPFSSCDSTNVARNVGLDGRHKGEMRAATKATRGIVLANRIETFQSKALWEPHAMQTGLEGLFGGTE